MIKYKQINNSTVSAIPQIGTGIDNRPIKGFNLFPEIYANVFLCAKKKSGKTSVIYKIIKSCATKDTHIIAFVSTLHKDSSWLSIKKYCEAKGINFTGYTSIMDGKADKLNELVDDLQNMVPKEDDKDSEPNPKQRSLLLCDSDSEEDEKPKKKSKYRSPEYIIILDDLSTELKSKSLVSLLKKNRHFKSLVVVSSQYMNDLLPESRKQLDYFLIFKGQSLEKLKVIYTDADLSIPFEEFVAMYEDATKEPYSFLYIDSRDDSYRKCFSHKIIL